MLAWPLRRSLATGASATHPCEDDTIQWHGPRSESRRPPIDREALRRKYREERDKRLRPDGNDQYLRFTGELARYLDDPYKPRTERAALTDHRTVICVGGGFAGLVVGAPSAYFAYIDKWRASGTFDGLEFR